MTSQPRRSFALRANLFLLSISRHWLRIVSIILAIYVSLPVVAPTLLKAGVTEPGRLLYTLYSPFCHQYAFRTLFLFGEQPAYPRYNSSGANGLMPFETYVQDLPEFAPDRVVSLLSVNAEIGDIYAFTPGFQGAAREFLGNERMGYKMTLCARDMAIYGGLLVGALIFSRVRQRLRPVPLVIYVILGLAPIAIDGFSQLLGYPPFNLWPPRETTPIFRVITGALFGIMNAWLGFPYLEMSMRETAEDIETKLQRAGIEV
jgi:uncharacterized membrane protein